MMDLVKREDVLKMVQDAIANGTDPEDAIKEIPSANPEQFTHIEKVVFKIAMEREIVSNEKLNELFVGKIGDPVPTAECVDIEGYTPKELYDMLFDAITQHKENES